LFLALAFAACLPAQESFPIASIEVQGAARFQPDAVIRASGLALQQPAKPADFEAACQRLAGTGIFETARYQFKPSGTEPPGYALTLLVSEAGDLQPVRLDFAGLDPAAAWKWFEQNEPLIQPQMPSTDQAAAFYTAAVERMLAAQGRAGKAALRLRNDPETGGVAAIFRPESLPVMKSFRFEGAQSVPAATLEKAMASAAGTEFSEENLRESLELNVRPLYYAQGRYKAQFESLRIADGVVSVTVVEGPVYTLGEVNVAGQDLPVPPAELAKLVPLAPGALVDWRKVHEAAAAMRAALGRAGYLDAEVEPDRYLDDQAGRIDLVFSVIKGRQLTFGALHLVGLDAAGEARARSLWKLAPGAVLSLAYLDEYEKLLMRDDKVRFRRISRRYEPRPGETAADVTFTFRP
jgi:outer membrane protein assembly factor BamA